MNYILIFFTLFTSLYSDVFFPNQMETSIKKIINKDSVVLNKPFPKKGMSGIVVHKYKDFQNISYSITQKEKISTLQKVDVFEHNSLPTSKIEVSIGDKVIGGYLYNRVLAIVPNASIYNKIVKEYSKKDWIHPDIFALFLSMQSEIKITKKNLKSFAKEYHIGLIYIALKNRAILVDAISGKQISQKKITFNSQKADYPFYTRIKFLEAGWFESEIKGDYFKEMEKFLNVR